ncbi:MAG: radical SAM protein [Polyangiaceae bacterium]
MSEGPRLPLLLEDPSIHTVTLALNYVCNSRCSFCFIEPELDMRLPDTSDEHVAAVFEENRRRQRYERLILAGAEATLRKDLPDIARRALAEGGFRVVRLQTNGRRLKDANYARQLVDAGISEFFVSVHAGRAELDRKLTRNPNSFAEMSAGLDNLRGLTVRLMSNTCVSASNVDDLDALATFLIDHGVPESHFWGFIEFGDIGQQAEHVAFARAVPATLAAARRLLAQGNQVVLSWFPRCMLEDLQHLLIDHRDDTLIHESFSSRAKAHGGFSCAHSASCARFQRGCMGLHERHVELIGDEAHLLRPLAAGE